MFKMLIKLIRARSLFMYIFIEWNYVNYENDDKVFRVLHFVANRIQSHANDKI